MELTTSQPLLQKQQLLPPTPSLYIVAPHPDDEVLGAGGIINQFTSRGGQVDILYMTVGDTQDYSKNGHSSLTERIKEIDLVSKYLGIHSSRIAFPGNCYHLQLDQIPIKEIISQIEADLDHLRPDIVLTPQSTDYNQDHQACSQAVIAATRPSPPEFRHRQNIVLGFEFAANGWGVPPIQTPNFWFEISSDDLDAKIQAMHLFSSQYRNSFHTRSPEVIRSLAKLRGAQVGVEFAEAFYSYRTLIPLL